MKELPEAFESVLGIVTAVEDAQILRGARCEVVFWDEDESCWRTQMDGSIANVVSWIPIPQEARDLIKDYYSR